MSAKRFRIAFSFAGEKRDLVAQVAGILAKRFGEDHILYDKNFEAKFARSDLGIHLAHTRQPLPPAPPPRDTTR